VPPAATQLAARGLATASLASARSAPARQPTAVCENGLAVGLRSRALRALEPAPAGESHPGRVRVILIRDAICSSSDAGHDALMQLYHQRYTGQIEVADAATIAVRWAS
jgi:hypothetical protein